MTRPHPIKWAYGIITVPQRLDNLLARTLKSLSAAGFDNPWLFIDGQCTIPDHLRQYNRTERVLPVKSYGSWLLGMWETYIRNPNAHRYVVFQDDILLCKNLRQYLDKCRFTEDTYWNLYTATPNEELAKGQGWYPSNQRGLGALALVLDRKGVVDLLRSQPVISWCQNPKRGWRNIDGTIAAGLGVKYTEMVHYPSLVQHTGANCSAIGNPVHMTGKTAQQRLVRESASFPGEEFDAMELLNSGT